MPHDIERFVASLASSVWMIEPNKAAEIVAALALRMQGQTDWAGDPRTAVYEGEPVPGASGQVHVLQLHGTLMPRGGMLSRMSGAGSLSEFQSAFRRAASDPTAQAIVIEIDSPGGMVDLVPETAAMIHEARRADRPIVAHANTMAASGAYWIAAACDEVVVTPSGMVGSIGAYTMHQDLTAAMEQRGIKRTIIKAGSRKIEGNPYEPLTPVARAALQARIDRTYDMFTKDVARFRGLPVSTVRGDPESDEQHMGGGRVYDGQDAVRLGMADRVETFHDTLMRVASSRRNRRTSTARARLSLS